MFVALLQPALASERRIPPLFTPLAAVAALELEIIGSDPATSPDQPLHRSGLRPDNIVLTHAGVAGQMSVAWRTSSQIDDGMAEYRPVGNGAGRLREVPAQMTELKVKELSGDNPVHCFRATLLELDPGVNYEYRVGSPSRDIWSEWTRFPAEVKRGDEFTFVYLGDTQYKLSQLGEMLSSIEERRPDTRFYLIAGDLVDDGKVRNEWDEFFHFASPTFSRKPLMPALGNHDKDEKQDIFSYYFPLPENGLNVSRECKNYYFTQGDVFFLVLDSNYSRSQQKSWLEQTLEKAEKSGYAFKVVMFHHPVFHSRAGRSSKYIQQSWLPALDEYGVDLVLSGHDHSYMRSYKIRNGEVVADDSPGTVFVVATGSDKFYEFQPVENAAVQFSDLATYQVIRLETPDFRPPVLHYQAFSRAGELVDAFSLTSQKKGGRISDLVAQGAAKMLLADIDPIDPEAKAETASAANPLDFMTGTNGVRDNGRLRVEGTQIVNQKGEVLQLRGLSSHGIHWYPQFINVRALLDIKSRGANLFRVAMYADSNKGGYNAGDDKRELNKRLLRFAVENSLAADLYTIIDWHLLEDENPLKRVEQAVDFFDEMSRLYSDEPGIIYEICNEPNGSATWRDIYQYAEKVIPVIRKNAPQAIIIVGTPAYSSKVLDVLESPLRFNNLVYAYHMNTRYTNYQFLRTLNKAREGDLAVFVSEWSIGKEKGRDYHDVIEGYDFLEYMRQHQISWAYWALCNKDRDYAIVQKESDKLWGWKSADLTIPGKIIFSALKNGRPQWEEKITD